MSPAVFEGYGVANVCNCSNECIPFSYSSSPIRPIGYVALKNVDHFLVFIYVNEVAPCIFRPVYRCSINRLIFIDTKERTRIPCGYCFVSRNATSASDGIN